MTVINLMRNTAISFSAFTGLDAIEEISGNATFSPLEPIRVQENSLYAILYSGSQEALASLDPTLSVSISILGSEVVTSKLLKRPFSIYSVTSKFIALSIANSII